LKDALLASKNAMGDSFRSNIKITLHLFDSLIKPILMYMNDFWGGFKAIDEKYHPIEKFHNMACKQILGVQKQTTNVGVLLELGRIPLQNFAVKAAIKNWERIKSGKINPILLSSHNDAIIDELPWITNIKCILQSHNLENIPEAQTRRTKYPYIHKILHKKQCEKFHENTFQTIAGPDNKLRTYALIKTEIGCEKYLDEIKNVTTRQALTKFRLSNSLLNIEKLRHTTPKTPKEERFCPFCPTVVEDEVHFLLDCPIYAYPRDDMMKNILHKNPLFNLKPTIQKFLHLMAPENAQFVAKAIHNFFEIRNFLMNKPRRPT
jgi:hypothetical protein